MSVHSGLIFLTLNCCLSQSTIEREKGLILIKNTFYTQVIKSIKKGLEA
jgi:hypothetical protein